MTDLRMQTLSTARLRLRPCTEDDADFILALLNDPDWLRFIGDKQVRTRADAQRYLREGPIAMVARYGHGLACAERISDGQALGMCGLIRRDALDDVDLGFAFLPAARGQGYAGEAAAAALAFGFDGLGLHRIVAITDPANQASVRVLKAAGLRFEQTLPATPNKAALDLYAIEPTSRT